MSPKQVSRQIDRRQWMARLFQAVPHQNHQMELTRYRNGGATARVALRKPRYMVPPLSWILPFSSHRHCELDRLGTEVLDMCNGQDSIEGIIEGFAVRHKLSFREAQIPVMQFLQQLTNRGIVAIVGVEEDDIES